MQVGKYEIKEGLFYIDSHEWVKIEGNIATVGISDYAQQELGDVAFIELPDAGKEVSKGGDMCEIESVKAVDTIKAPVSGKVVENNSELESSAEKINADPYGAWIAKIEMSDESEKDALKDAAAYAEFVKGLAGGK